MADLNDILERLNQLTKEVNYLKAQESTAKTINNTTENTINDLSQIITTLKQYIDSLPNNENDTFIFHSIIRPYSKKASAQVTSINAILEDDSYSTAKYCLALSNEHRINILKALANNKNTSSELSEFTGLEGGPLYHHIKELIQAQFVAQQSRNQYKITEEGLDVLLTVCALNRRNTYGNENPIWIKGDEKENDS